MGMGIYIHIPFCVKKCAYCDFLSAPCDAKERASYVEALIREIKRSEFAATDRSVHSIFFGGGTPSLLEVNQLEAIMTALAEAFDIASDAEISMECNPGTVDVDKLRGFRECGINRLSIGLQSANDDELKVLGRIHDYSQFLKTYENARAAGFANINIDIMSAIPGQTYESYIDTLDKVIALNPEHISSYSLIIEEGTPFYDIYGDGGTAENGADVPRLPDEDTEREMYYETKRRLEAAGYHRYEISNYARDGYECRHNKVYWTGDDYLSFGIGASSYVDGIRWNNIEEMYPYMKFVLKEESVSYGKADELEMYSDYGFYDMTMDEDEDSADSVWDNREAKAADGQAGQEVVFDDSLPWRCDINRLSRAERMEEFMIVGLRMMCGVSKSKWRELFDCDIESVYGHEIERFVSEGLMEVYEAQADEYIRLTERGIDVSNTVLAYFLH